MATTKMIRLHVNHGKSDSTSLHERMDYIKNDLKTNEGELVSSYGCEVDSATEEFMYQRSQYQTLSGRSHKNEVLSYLIIQSYKPGEITPEKANELGYQLALRFTKGKHSFVVATHNDRAHIHNHIIFNSVTMDSTRKFIDQYRSWEGLKKLSDIICLENGLSVIDDLTNQRNKRKVDHVRKSSKRDVIYQAIDEILTAHPNNLDEFYDQLKAKGYEIKYGKHVSLKGPEQQRFVRFRSLKEGYQLNDIENRIKDTSLQVDNYSFLKDLENQILNAKNDRWKKRIDLKQAAKTLLFLQEQNISSLDELELRTNECADRITYLQDSIKSKQEQLDQITVLRNQIFDYVKTKDIYKQYVQSKFSKKFYIMHQADIDKHEKAKKTFDQLDRIPKVKELNKQIQSIISVKRKEYSELKDLRSEFKQWVSGKERVQVIMEDSNGKINRNLEL